MKKIVASCILMCVTSLIFADDGISIKGYYPGMEFPKESRDFECYKSEHGGLSCIKTDRKKETIGGADITEILARLSDGATLDYMLFKFDPDDYKNVLLAVLGKYKKAKCKQSNVETSMGAKRTNEECTYFVGRDFVTVSRYYGKITEGGLVIGKMPTEEESMQRSIRRYKDI